MSSNLFRNEFLNQSSTEEEDFDQQTSEGSEYKSNEEIQQDNDDEQMEASSSYKNTIPFRLNKEQRIWIYDQCVISKFQYNNLQIKKIQNEFKKEFCLKESPASTTIQRLYNKFQETGSVLDNLKGVVGRKTVRTEEKINKVKQYMVENPKTSVRDASKKLKTNTRTLHRILKIDLKLCPYKIQIMHKIPKDVYQKRNAFCIKVQEMVESGRLDPNLIFFTDEAYFTLEGYVNKQNYRIWGSEPPKEFAEAPLHSRKIQVWCAVYSGGVSQPFFYEENENCNGPRYLQVIKDFFEYADGMDAIDDHWWMQDGAPPHRTGEVFNQIQKYYGERVMALNYTKYYEKLHNKKDVLCLDWPPYSPDLNACDYFLWGYLKDKVYAEKIRDIEHLKKRITDEINNIPTGMLRRVVSNFLTRIKVVADQEGGHCQHILTKKN